MLSAIAFCSASVARDIQNFELAVTISSGTELDLRARMANVEVDQALLSWRESGAGEAIVFIHAFPLDSSMWEDQLAAMPAGWRAIAPDLPGFGRSGARDGVTSIDRFADDVAALLPALGIERAVFCGLSMGGYVALALLKRHPQVVRALILSDTRAEPDTREGRIGSLELAKRTRQEGMKPVIDSMFLRLVSRTTRLAHPAIAARVQETMRTTTPANAALAMAAMAHRADSTPVLRDIAVPTLVIVGSEDEITPPGESQMLARAIRGARIEIIEGAGHLPNMELPDTFNSVIRTFLATLPL